MSNMKIEFTAHQPFTAPNSRAGLVITPQLVVGGVLLILFVMQLVAGVQWDALKALQSNSLYKQLTGLLLGFFIARQFRLGLARMKKRTSNIRSRLAQHKWQGVLAPLLFFVHSTTLGYAYTLILSVVFLSNIAVGLINVEVVRVRAQAYLSAWMVVHVGLAMATVGLAAFHVYIVYFYA